MIWYIIHFSICMGQLVFAKKNSAGCIQIQTISNYHKAHKNSTFRPNHGTTKWNEITHGHCMPLHVVIASPKLQDDQATSLRLLPCLSVFCTEFTSLRIKCLMAPSLFSSVASRMSRPRIPFKSKIC